MEIAKIAKIAKVFSCIKCDYKCRKKSDYIKHLLTIKHKKSTMETYVKTELLQPEPIVSYSCECSKEYASRAGLWKHKKKCTYVSTTATTATTLSTQQSMVDLISQNKELIDMMVVQNKKHEEERIRQLETTSKTMEMFQEQNKTISEMIPKIGNTTNNNQFNLNVFLNEDCKNALNLSDFVNQIQIEVSDMDYTRTTSLECGLKSIIHKALNGMAVLDRPIHCTDSKRRTMYVKENDVWEKDSKDTNHQLMKKGVDALTYRQLDNIKGWVAENPSYNTSGRQQDAFVELARVCSENLTEAQTARIIGTIAANTSIPQANRIGDANK